MEIQGDTVTSFVYDMKNQRDDIISLVHEKIESFRMSDATNVTARTYQSHTLRGQLAQIVIFADIMSL